jgi:hypothetical protein
MDSDSSLVEEGREYACAGICSPRVSAMPLPSPIRRRRRPRLVERAPPQHGLSLAPAVDGFTRAASEPSDYYDIDKEQYEQP